MIKFKIISLLFAMPSVAYANDSLQEYVQYLYCVDSFTTVHFESGFVYDVAFEYGVQSCQDELHEYAIRLANDAMAVVGQSSFSSDELQQIKIAVVEGSKRLLGSVYLLER